MITSTHAGAGLCLRRIDRRACHQPGWKAWSSVDDDMQEVFFELDSFSVALWAQGDVLLFRRPGVTYSAETSQL